MALIKINEHNVYYEAPNFNPNALPIIFVHGAGGTSHKWAAQLPHLSKRFNPIAVDLPGHGNSDGQGFNLIADYSAFIKAFADALNLNNFALAGQSMGGGVTLDFAFRYPELLKAMVLIDTGARLRVAPDFLETMRLGHNPPNLIQLAYSSKTPEDVIINGEKDFKSTSNPVRYGDFLACDAFDLRASLAEIRVPALVICGEEDLLTPLKSSEFLKDNLPLASLDIIPNAGHMSMIEQPEAVNMAIETFLHTLAGCNLEF